MRSVLTIGTFDVPHLGHAFLFRKCLELGTDLVVGVNSDRFVGSYKGIAPTYDQDERMSIIAALGYRVELNDGPGRDLIYSVKPAVLAIGDDWMPGKGKDYLRQIDMLPEDFDVLGCTLAFIPLRIQSTTEIRARLAA